jgi:hypothetical protein
MSRLLIATFHPGAPPGKHRDRDMLLADRIRSGGIGDLPDGNGGRPPVTVRQLFGNSNQAASCPARSCSLAARSAATGGNESRHLTVLTANPAWGWGRRAVNAASGIRPKQPGCPLFGDAWLLAPSMNLWWWKFASPVRDVDTITVRGSRRDLPGQAVIRVSSFTSHWLQREGIACLGLSCG